MMNVATPIVVSHAALFCALLGEKMTAIFPAARRKALIEGTEGIFVSSPSQMSGVYSTRLFRTPEYAQLHRFCRPKEVGRGIDRH
jgi:hypothetical protein